MKIDHQKLSTLKKKEKNVGGKKVVLVIYRIIMKGSIFVQLESEMERNVVWDTYLASNSPQGSLKKQESSRKTSISALMTMPKPLTVWTTTTLENSFFFSF